MQLDSAPAMAMHSGAEAPGPPEFSMVLGGPVYQAFLRLHVAQPPLGLIGRRIILMSLLPWVPLLVLSILIGRAWGNVHIPFLKDVDVNARFLVALPILVLAEAVVHSRFLLL